MNKKINYWLPRILAIIFIIFISLFALDAFDGSGFWKMILGFVIHLIPTFILIGITVWAWKKPEYGGWAFVLLGCVFVVFFNLYKDPISLLLIAGPVFLVGVLFLLEGKKGKGKRKKKKR
ncbi:hypothetical protein HOD14_01200 [Candidatus Woesearchaeota archaeon]|jgi:hypothetical protein|nr:hypothetical protein [Candidatus Woesearchaeota archaeon]MBT4367968.1 hypothetical protein [Candidatus Woesearchaeota archaeon]MBT6639369.1 hypothetical protein [Candidatus Woesearchaeota archaeon]MBT7133541.1 hypothetical protein [Candidatus Woesearchaeota archaeon]MBT7441456.1 hypothetical protein [Candidatus Woesearchaeota archaeon]